MKINDELKEKTKELEKSICNLIGDFIEKNGSCEIRVAVSQSYFIQPGSGEKIRTSLDVDVILTI